MGSPNSRFCCWLEEETPMNLSFSFSFFSYFLSDFWMDYWLYQWGFLSTIKSLNPFSDYFSKSQSNSESASRCTLTHFHVLFLIKIGLGILSRARICVSQKSYSIMEWDWASMWWTHIGIDPTQQSSSPVQRRRSQHLWLIKWCTCRPVADMFLVYSLAIVDPEAFHSSFDDD